MASRVGLTARTVLVHRGSVNSAYSKLSKIMRKTGLDHQIKIRERNEKPTKKRVRLEYEKCARLYHREMKRKIDFVMQQNNPLPITAVMTLNSRHRDSH